VSEQPFFLSKNTGFVDCSSVDDYLHPKANAKRVGDTLTETQYLGISIPEERIHGLFNCWHHPNLGVVTGGAWIWQGIKPHHLACELFDIRSFMGDEPIRNDLHSYTLDNSYGVKVIEPLKKLHARYSDPSRKNSFDLEYTALAPPVMFANGLHFDQGMKVAGELVLQGKCYDVNGYNVRDRSWGALRPEDHVNMPPMSWMTGSFGDDLFFNITGFDHPDLEPDYKEFMEFSAENTLNAGWIHRDGKVFEIVECRKHTVRNRQTMFPELVTMDMTDVTGRVYKLKGEIIAASNWSAWLNVDVTIALAQWDCDGRTGYGDVQDAHWHDWIRGFMGY
jgi:hypothetical protein